MGTDLNRNYPVYWDGNMAARLLSVYLSDLCLSIFLSTLCLSISLTLFLSVCPSCICLSICSMACMFFCLFRILLAQ